MPTYLPIQLRAACVLIALVFLAGCATPMPRKDDPYESFNRKMFAFNEKADRVAIRPIAIGYRKITNRTTRRLIGNFFSNVETPITIANDLLQGQPKYAFTATMRLVINTTVGVLGFLDPASSMGIDQHDSDFGVTLAKWGMPEGPYLVLPLFGSTTLRDFAGFPVDRYLFDPLAWYAFTHDFRFRAQYLPTSMYLVTIRENMLDMENLLDGVYDKYVFFRDAYRQRRLYKIYNGNPPAEAIQALQGVDEVDVDKLLLEQEKYEKKQPDASPPLKPPPSSAPVKH